MTDGLLLPSARIPSVAALEDYWRAVGDAALAHMGGRLLNLVRRENSGVDFHRGPLPELPPAIHQRLIEKSDGTRGVRVWVDDLDGLLGLTEIGVVEIHPWGSKVDDIEHPDMLVFNLKPGPDVDWDFVVESAQRLRHVLAEADLDSWPKTTGDDSLHVMVPAARRRSWKQAADFAKKIAHRLEATSPERYTISARADRRGRLLIDYLRNGRGSTAIGAYSPRALPGFPVAAALTWEELERGARPDRFTLDNPPSPHPHLNRRRCRGPRGNVVAPCPPEPSA